MLRLSSLNSGRATAAGLTIGFLLTAGVFYQRVWLGEPLQLSRLGSSDGVFRLADACEALAGRAARAEENARASAARGDAAEAARFSRWAAVWRAALEKEERRRGGAAARPPAAEELTL